MTILDPGFILIAFFTLLSGVAVFVARRVIHSVIALAMAFTGSALLFFYLNQSIVGLLQLFVFVGGLSTYLIVAVASERNKQHTNVHYFFILLIALGTSLTFVFFNPSLELSSATNNFLSSASTAFGSYYAVFYLLAALLFSTVIGSILIIKKFVRLIV